MEGVVGWGMPTKELAALGYDANVACLDGRNQHIVQGYLLDNTIKLAPLQATQTVHFCCSMMQNDKL